MVDLPNSPSVGDQTTVGGRSLIFNGVGWEALLTGLGPVVGVQMFGTGSGTYVPTAGAVAALGIAQAPGGGGGGVGNTTGLGEGGNGGAGETRIFVVNPLIGSYAYSVGAIGTGGSAGNNPGTTGGDVTFGSIVTAKGGTNGAGSTGATVASNGSTPTGSGGVRIEPACDPQSYFAAGGPRAGGSIFGQGPINLNAAILSAINGATANNGFNAGGRGAGGLGGYVNTGTNTASGGDAAPGFLLIIEYGSALVGSALTSDFVDIFAVDGLTLANNATDANNDIDIAAGRAMDNTGTDMMILTTRITKRADATWAAGSGQGGFDIGGVADPCTVHHYLIKNPSTKAVDVLMSLSPERSGVVTISAANPAVVTWSVHGLSVGARVRFSSTGTLPSPIVANTDYFVISGGWAQGSFRISTAQGGAAVNTNGSSQSGVHTAVSEPIMPSGYTHRRRIGSLLHATGAFNAFKQFGDIFHFTGTIVDFSSGAAAADALLTMSCPMGVKTSPQFTAACSPAATCGDGWIYIGDGDGTESTFGILRWYGGGGTHANPVAPGTVWTNYGASIWRELTFGTGTIYDAQFYTIGYMDLRRPL